MKCNRLHTLKELEGWTEIRQSKEALHLVRCMLESAELDAVHFGAAIKVVLTFANKLRPWTETVEAAFRRLPPKDRDKAMSWMLGFYYSQSDFQKASVFVPGCGHEGK